VGEPAFDAVQGILQAIAHRTTEPGLLDILLSLFAGHDIPALYWARGRRPGFYKSPGMSRRLVFEAHLLGAVMVGSYPFRGVTPWCGCAEHSHSCDGVGASYLCLDLDAHGGESDTSERCRRVMSVCWRLGLLPVVFSSRSGVGAHVYLFLNEHVSTRDANAAGKAIARLAGITSRCDVIPSAEHPRGMGTLHALPLSPMSDPGGGVLFDSHLRPVVDRGVVVSLLRWANENRSPVSVVRDLAQGLVSMTPLAPAQTRLSIKVKRKLIVRGSPTLADEKLLKAMRLLHPQFRRALSVPPKKWRGKRSGRDAYLVGYMRRQGMTAAGVVAAMMSLPGTKAAERGEDYAWELVSTQAETDWDEFVLAGQRLKPAKAKLQRQRSPWAPWDARVAPPKSYVAGPNPWWRQDVQARLKKSRGRADAILLAYLIDRYHRGPIERRMYYASQRGLARKLGYPATTMGTAARRLGKRFSDVLRVVPGVSHPTLRIANGYYVPENRHNDPLDWYLAPTRDLDGNN